MADEAAAARVNPIAALLRQLVLNDTRQTNNRPRAIQSRTFSCGQDFSNFITHFRACVKAAYNFTLPTDEAALDEACLLWLGMKLEPGSTLITYESLPNATRTNWTRTVDALTEAFADETEKETFLADQTSFKRGDKSLVQYKNELMRLMRIYLPNLIAVPEEFQRQACTRFIEGLDNEELKRLLRRHCRRDKNTIDEAYSFTVDFESAELQSNIREGDSAASFGRDALAATSHACPTLLQRQSRSRQGALYDPSTGVVGNPLAEQVRDLASSIAMSELRVDDLDAESKLTDERIDILGKEMGQLSVNQTKMEKSMVSMEKSMDSKFDRMEKLLLNYNQGGCEENGGVDFSQQ